MSNRFDTPIGQLKPWWSMIFYMMGVSGSGKSVIGSLLAERLSIPFYDGDDFHSLQNKTKMAAGQPLSDEDRWPWLQRLNAIALEAHGRGTDAVIVCSALKQQYRDLLAKDLPASEVCFILLEGSRELVARRLALRRHEFMNPNLLDSQLATLEYPRHALRIVNDRPPAEVVEEIAERLSHAVKELES